jgi:hypothetical protein
MADLLLIVIVFVLIVMWAHAVATYDWSKFDEHSRDDDFLKPHDKY